MSEWVSNNLGELVTFQKGRKVDTSQFPQPGYEAYLGAGALSGKDDGYGSTFLSVQANENDVLMLWDGERSGLTQRGLTGVVSSTVCKLSPNGSISSELLYYFLNLNFVWIQNRRTGTGVPHVPKDIGRILEITYPCDKDEQQKIARILQTIDRAIEQTKALIDKYQHIKVGLMYDLFTRGIGPDGQLRPPREQAPHRYQQTPIGWIPKEWEVEKICDAVDSIVDGPFGSNLKTEHYISDPGVRVIRLQNVVEHEYNDNDKAYISENHANYLIRNQVIGDDVLIAGLGEERYPVGRSCLYPVDLPPAVNKADCFRARCKPNAAHNKYFMLFLNSEYARKQIRRYEQGVTRPRINTGNLKKIMMPLPSLEEQSGVIRRFDAAQQKVSVEMEILEKLQKQKSGLMHDLLTGKVSVTPDPEPVHG